MRTAVAGIFFFLLLAVPCAGWTMDKADLVTALKSGAPAEADLIENHPAEIAEETVAFLAPWISVRVTIRMPHHPIFLTVAYQEGRNAWVISRGEREYELFRDDAKPKVESEAQALEAVRWFLRSTRGAAFLPVERVEDIPFLPVTRGDERTPADIDAAKKRLEGKLHVPTVYTVADQFEVRLCAIHHRTLAEYTITVTRTGRFSVRADVIEKELPVVWVQ